MQGQDGPLAGCLLRSRSAAQMDGCSRQNPAYRPANEKPRLGGASLYGERLGTRRGIGRRDLGDPDGTARRGRPVKCRWLTGSASHRAGDATSPPHALKEELRAGQVEATAARWRRARARRLGLDGLARPLWVRLTATRGNERLRQTTTPPGTVGH